MPLALYAGVVQIDENHFEAKTDDNSRIIGLTVTPWVFVSHTPQ